MKAIVILILGSLPLGVLTVWSFVELRSIEDQAVTGAVLSNNQGRKADVRADQDRTRTERRITDRLAAADFFAGESISALESLPPASGLERVASAWTTWGDARRMVGQFLDTHRAAETDGLPELEGARDQLAALEEAYQSTGLGGRRHFLMLVGQETTALEKKIARIKLERRARLVLERADEAFRRQEHAGCVALCDELLDQHVEVLDPVVIGQVRVRRKRALFWGDVKVLQVELERAEGMDRHKALLEDFLTEHGRLEGQTTSERQKLDQYAAQLQALKTGIAAEARSRAAAAEIRTLTENLPGTFVERLQAASRIGTAYPDEPVLAQLRAMAVAWFDQYLPAGGIQEEEMLEEAETTDGRIIQGFFKEVVDPEDGRISAYKPYPTKEEFINPMSDVGTYHVNQLRRRPGPSVPRQCVQAYNQSRMRLLQGLARRDAWAEFAAQCEALDGRLEDYRAKPGSSNKPLSFTREARVARDLLAGSALDHLQVICGE